MRNIICRKSYSFATVEGARAEGQRREAGCGGPEFCDAQRGMHEEIMLCPGLNFVGNNEKKLRKGLISDLVMHQIHCVNNP